MKMNSDSWTVSGASGSSDSLIGLKFGEKIYFEDVGIGIPAKSVGGSSSVSISPGPPKKGRGFVQGGQPPRCQVEGCQVDLSDAKAYYSRHKVCGMHSKSPTVIVAGLEQRFCQQCSRFHKLPEFDEGKRSCRRRLAGHNERRRKPPPNSLLSSCHGRLPSSLHENSSRVGGFLMDFTRYPRLPGRDSRPNVRASDWVAGNQPTFTGKFVPHLWQGSSENPPPNSFLQGSAGGMVFSSPGIPPGECFAGVSDSSCALSLLSTQPWGSRNPVSGLSMNNVMNEGGTPIAQSTAPHGSVTNNFMSNAWSFMGNEASSSSHEMQRVLGVGQVSQPINSQFPGELELATQQGGGKYMELGHSMAYGSSTQQMHWPL
ncbi:hypothetical protein HHK36_011990 [Tetracentron sinense]|uniref:SBP-type domain-containing protein n=1 Tax=Tetracentron sinense TaxID=13715 RepID=A0A834Z9E8_TETSI|nr:hypothetical protein HHK36_011990 [Tetracentron sinense]